MYTTEAVRYQHKQLSGWVGWISWWEGGEPVIKTSCGLICSTPQQAVKDAQIKLERLQQLEKNNPLSWSTSGLQKKNITERFV